MAPRKLSILLFLSLSLALVLSSCLPLPFTGGNRVLSPEDVRATVQTGIEQTLTAQRRIQDATAAAGAVANVQPATPLVQTETAAVNEEGSEIPDAGSTQAETPEAIVEFTAAPEVDPTQTATRTATYTVTSTSTPTDIPATSTPAPTDTPEPSPTPFDPNITPTSTPPPTITPLGFQAPPDTPVPPTPAPTETPAVTPTTADLVRLQVDTATYCRSGPGRSYDLLDALLPEEWARVIGRSLSEKYYVIETPRGTNNCWLWARYTEVDGDIESLAYLDAAEAPALPEYTHSEDAVCRTGPEEDQPMMATLRGGTTAEIIGRAEMDTWLLVRIPFRWVTCWVPGEDAQLTGNLQAAPVLGAQLPISGGNPVEITATPQATVEAPEQTAPPAAAQPPAAQPVLTPVAGLACRIMSQSPSTNTTISLNASFEASWTIRNIGSETWESNMVDIHYLAGNRIHRSPDRFDLPRSMFTGESVTIKLQMVAPGNPGRYTINWAMSSEDNTFCAMPMTLEVR
jgi:hypothetical protein